MSSLANVFTESERTNWMKKCLAVYIAKSGLEQFAENEVKTVHSNKYNAILSSDQAPIACIGCHTVNMLKCPLPGICIKQGAQSICPYMHSTAFKQPRPCPANVCNKVLIEIAKQHIFPNPSLKNTLANQWASNPLQIAKAFLPPDGYTGKSSVQDTDFNGIISFIIKCKHSDNKSSITIAPVKTHPPCILTKARELGRAVLHLPTCKVTDKDLQDIFIILTSLLTDTQCLAHDVAAREAVRKLVKLQTDLLKITTKEMVRLIEAAQDNIEKTQNITETAMDELRIYIKNCRKDLNSHADKCKKELADHTGECNEEIDEHVRKYTETTYEQSCNDFRRRLLALNYDTYSNVPLSNLDQSLDKRIVDIYRTQKGHRIEIEKDGKRLTKGRVLTYKEILYKEIYSNRRIRLQGDLGSGKSTFSAKLVHDWPHGNQDSSETTAFNDVLTIQTFELLFFKTFRTSRGQTDVTQMIKNQLIDTTFSEDEHADEYKHFVQIMKTEICLVVLDGLDGSNLAEPSMAGFLNDTCTILTTTRPWKLTDKRTRNLKIDRLLEIKGISDPYEFSENILRGIIEKTTDLKEAVDTFNSFIEDRQLKSMSSSPIQNRLVICTWVDTIEEEEHLKESSLGALHTILVERLCKKAKSTTVYFNDSNPPQVLCFSSTRYLQLNIKHLDKLAVVAYKLLFSSEREVSIVFNDKILSNYFPQEEITFALQTEILTSKKDKSRKRSANSFIHHKTVQELLAAYPIACNAHVIQNAISRYLNCYNNSYLEISQVLIFLCGMNILAANEMSSLMDQCDVAHGHCSTLYPSEFQRIIESGIREANKQYGIDLKLSYISCADTNNMRELNSTSSKNTSNVKSLATLISFETEFMPSSLACDEPTSDLEFNRSSCNKLQSFDLCGKDYWLRGSEDCCCCFDCGGELINLEPENDPWKEHCRWFPCCSHVSKVKGDDFIKQHQQMQHPSDDTPTDLVAYDDMIVEWPVFNHYTHTQFDVEDHQNRNVNNIRFPTEYSSLVQLDMTNNDNLHRNTIENDADTHTTHTTPPLVNECFAVSVTEKQIEKTNIDKCTCSKTLLWNANGVRSLVQILKNLRMNVMPAVLCSPEIEQLPIVERRLITKDDTDMSDCSSEAKESLL